MNAKTLLVVERNAVGVQMLRAARAAGVKTVLLTRDAGAVRMTDEVSVLCDEIVRAETNDLAQAVAAALAFARVHTLDAVCPGHEYQVPLAAEIARRLRLVGHAPETVVRVRDKLAMKTALSAAGVPTARCAGADTLGQALAFVRDVGFPVVVKPRDGGGSKNVVRVDSEEQLAMAYERCRDSRRFPLTGRLLSGEVLVEEYVGGPEVSVESVSLAGEHHVLAITDKTLGRPPHFVELGHVIPTRFPSAVQEAVRDVAVAALEAVGLRDGPAHVELKVTDVEQGGASVIEVAGRAGGDDLPRLVTLATGNDILRCTLDVLLERRLRLVDASPCVAVIRFLVAERSGRVAALRKPLEVPPAVAELRFLKRVGDVVENNGDNYDRLACAIAVARDREPAIRAAEDALAQVEVEFRPAP